MKNVITRMCAFSKDFGWFLLLFVCKPNFKEDNRPKSVCVRARAHVCVCVCLSVCLSLASDSSEAIKVIIIKFGMVTASDMIMHHVLIILSLIFIQGHTFDYFRKCSSNAHLVCCEDCTPTKGLYKLFLVWWPRSSLKVTIASQI